MANELILPNVIGGFLQGQQFTQQRQDAAQQNQLRALQLQQAQDQFSRDAQFRNELAAYMQGGSNNLAAMFAANPERAMQFQTFQTQQNKFAHDEQVKQAKQAYASAQYVLASNSPKKLAEARFPQEVEALKAQGFDWESATDDDVRQVAENIAAQAGSLAGIAPEFTAPEAGQVDGREVFFQANKTTGGTRVLPGVSPRPQKPLVQLSMAQEGKEAQTVGEAFGKMYADLQQAGSAAPAKLSKLDRMESLMQGVQTGKLAPAMTQIASIAESFGLKVDSKLGAKQALDALSNEIALSLRNPAGGAGMPGALSDKDREFLASMTPGLSKTPAGNRLIIDTARKLAQREQQVAKLAREYRKKNGHLDEGFYDELAEFSAANPLFGAEGTAKTTVTEDGWIIREEP